MALSQGKYKPAICAIDEVDDGIYKPDSSSDEFVATLAAERQQIEGSETAPLTLNQQKLHIDDKMTTKTKMITARERRQQQQQQQQETALTSVGAAAATEAATATATATAADNEQAKRDASSGAGDGNGAAAGAGGRAAFHSAMNGLRGRVSFDALMRLSRKQRVLYTLTACLCALLVLFLLLAVIFWPEVPYHYRAAICREPECMEASQQLLRWANTNTNTKTNINPCNDSYGWACGNFQRDYIENDYFTLRHGEWNQRSYNENAELIELHRFISTLPPSGATFTIESLITNLYRSCRVIDELDKSQSIVLLKNAINSIDGFTDLQNYDPKKALVRLHSSYGIFPLFKIDVKNRYNVPHAYIIRVDEGELGLPGAHFYNDDQQVIRAYQLLLRDFALEIGYTTTEADQFTDGVFHYEKRIVNALAPIKLNEIRELNKIVTLNEVKAIASSLPIAETLNAMFAKTKIAGDTEVMLADIEVLQELSNIVSTSDKKPIKELTIWSLARQMLPHLSKEYRQLIDNFERAIYQRSAGYPRWLSCTRIVRDWVPLAVDALQQQRRPKRRIWPATSSRSSSTRLTSTTFAAARNTTYGNDEMLNLIFNSVRMELLATLKRNQRYGRNVEELAFIKEKLISMRLQFGIPNEIYEQQDYVRNYYSDLLLHNMYFVQFRTPFWDFHKSRMERKLEAQNPIDTIILEMYTHTSPPTVFYSEILNMVFVSRGIVFSKYFDYRYPAAVNFARIGGDILATLIASLATFMRQYNAEHQYAEYEESGEFFARTDIAHCLNDDELSYIERGNINRAALERLHLPVSATKIGARALSNFLRSLDESVNNVDAVELHALYGNLGLLQQTRLAGLRELDENRLYGLASMQKHCGATFEDADDDKAQQLSERFIFKFIWQHVKFLANAVGCHNKEANCASLL